MTTTKKTKESRRQTKSTQNLATATRNGLQQNAPFNVAANRNTVALVNSRVRLTDLASGRSRTCTIVEPEDSVIVPDGISISCPLGAALMGCQVGDVIQCWELTRSRDLRIDAFA